VIAVDTSVLVDFFRGRKTAAALRLEELERSRTPFSIPLVCCQEILQGARDSRQWKLLRDYLDTQILLHSETPGKTHFDAARIFFDCRRKGLTIRSTIDCWIAQTVLESDGVLLHDDQDFEHIKLVRPLKTLCG